MSRPISELPAYLERKRAILKKTVELALLNLTTSVVLKTPVDTGNLRANWNASVDAPDLSVTPFTGDAGSGAQAPMHSRGSQIALLKARSVASQAVGKDFFLSNGVEYAYKNEKGWHEPKESTRVSGGFSTQSPGGFVGISVKNFKRLLKRALQESVINDATG